MNARWLNWIAVALLAALSPLSYASNEGSVTFEVHAERLDRLLEDLSKNAHVQLKAGHELSGEIVAVSVHDVTVTEFKKRLAYVTYGRWETEGRTSYLVRPSLPFRDATQDLAERKLNVERGFYMQWPVTVPNPGGVETVNWGSTPDGRKKDRYEIELYELLQLIGEDAIASVEPNRTLRYSTNPSSGYLPLEKIAIDLIQKVADEEPKPSVSTGKAVANVEVTLVWEDPWIESVNAFVMATDVNNERTWAISLPIVLDHVMPRPRPAPPAPPDQGLLVLSRRTKDALRTLDLMARYDSPVPFYESSEDKNVVARTLESLKHPDLVDPLWYVSDILIADAKMNARQFVACLPDSICDSFLDRDSLSHIDSTIAACRPIFSTHEAEWFTVRPSRPDEARVDRGLLSDLGTAIADNEPYTLPRLVGLLDRGLNSSTWQGYDSSGREEGPVKFWLRFQHEPTRWDPSNVDGRVASFLGHLPASDLEVLTRGGKLEFSDMPAGKVREVLSILSDASPFWTIARDSRPFLKLSIDTEPLFLRVEGNRYDVLSGLEERYIWGDIHDLAALLVSPKTRFQMGTRERYSLELHDARGELMEAGFELMNVDVKSKPLRPYEFPTEIASLLAADRENMKRAIDSRPTSP